MGTNIANAIILRTIKPLLDAVFSTYSATLRHASRNRPRDGDGTCHYATNFIQENWTEETMRKAAILANNALNAFVAAYNSWEWALLVCQKQSHRTLSVWLYQMSRNFAGTPWVVMAGFVLVSIPTAAVFLLCQRVIMRGIVLPSVK